MASNYPGGFPGGVTIRGISLSQTHPGEVFHVNNSAVLSKGSKNASNNNDGSFLAPFSTLTYALTQTTANRGDIIVLGAGHTETVSTAGGLDFNVAGVAVVGIGVGSLRPAIVSSETASTVVISAANTSFSNLSFEAGKAEVVLGVDISAVDGVSFDNCYWTEGATAGTFNYVNFIDLATGCDDFSMSNCRLFGRDTNNDAQINGVAHDGFYLDNCQFFNVVAPTTTGTVICSGNVTNIEIKHCDIYSNVDGAICLLFSGSACTGVIKDTHFGSADTADFLAGGGNATGAHFLGCKGSGDPTKYGAPMGGDGIYNNA